MNLDKLHDELKIFNWLNQESIEKDFNKRSIKKLIRADVSVGLETQIGLAIDGYYEYLGTEWWDSKEQRIQQILELSSYDLVIEVLTAVAVYTEPVPVQQVVGKIAPYLGFDDVFAGIQTASEILAAMSVCGLYSLGMINNRMHVVSGIILEDSTYEAIGKVEFLPPSLVPVGIEDNLLVSPSYKQSVLLGKTEHHNGEMCMDVIEIQNNINLCLDEYMLEYEEESTKETQIDTPDKLKAFEVMKVRSREVYELMVQNQNSFYLPHSNDGRGRLYSRGYHVAHQAGQYKRACININEAHYMSE